MTSIAIDLNVRLPGGETYAGFEDIVDTSIPEVGEVVRVFEPESELQGKAEVRRVDAQKRLIYLAVDWAALRPPVPRVRNADAIFGPIQVVLDTNIVGVYRALEFDSERLGAMIHVQNMVGLRCRLGEMRPSVWPPDVDDDADIETILVNSAD